MRPSILLPLLAVAACGRNFVHHADLPDTPDFIGDDSGPFPFGIQPEFGATVTQAVPC